MSWRTAWRLADPAFTELSFQAIYGLRRGNLLPADRPEELAARARSRVIQSKLLVSLVVGLIALSIIAGLSPSLKAQLAPALPEGLYTAGVLSAVLVLELAFLWWTGLQVLPTYLGSGILPVLEVLPIAGRTIDRVALLLLLRLFDLPALTCILLTPVAVGIALGSVWAGLAMLPGVFAAVLLAIAFALATGRFFVRRVQGARGGPGQTVLRWTYLVLWAIPAFAMYGFLTFGTQFFQTLTRLVTQGPAFVLTVIGVTFPFPLALLPVFAQNAGAGSDLPASLPLPTILLASFSYLLVVAGTALWLLQSARQLARQLPEVQGLTRPVNLHLEPRSAFLAVLWKDLRTASRTPGYAFLILLPILDAVAVGLLAFVVHPLPSDVFNLGAAAVATAALLATFFGPAFFAIEAMGFAYTRTLPLSDRSLLFGKVALIALLYLIAAALIIALTSTRVFAPAIFLLFVFAEFPAVLAAAFFELGILFRQARRAGAPIVNMYSGAWRVAVVTIPGLILAGLPIGLFQYLRAVATTEALGIMGVVAFLELAFAVPLALGLNRRKSA